MTKPKFNAPIVSASINRTEEILSLDNDLQVKTDMWSAQYNMGSGSKTEDEQAKKVCKVIFFTRLIISRFFGKPNPTLTN